MKKQLAMIMACLFIAGAATACSSNDSTSSSSSKVSSSSSAMESSSSTASSETEQSEVDSSSTADSSVASRVTQDPELLQDFVGTWEADSAAAYFILNEDSSAALYDGDGTALDEEGYYSVDGSNVDITFLGITESAVLEGDTITLTSGGVYNRVIE